MRIAKMSMDKSWICVLAVGLLATGCGGEEVAAVLTYVRNSFGNKASVVKPDKVKKIREATKKRATMYTAPELLKEHPN